ncbi:sugar MFS transporter [Sphingomonas rhizophila]|uniref:Sugar MFS transporter n=1 Tax=Sphingomonas rhizophila TaxID=2071607 RepID=A0A7G9SBD1_9SPHN|nr:sugar MFS transporter [Sphingomonas rhizophila]QNN65156.1 sugar MFS transporter [Sphingomonas rhizophila]
MVSESKPTSGVTGAFIIVTCLFFAWGFITALNDPLVAAVKGIFTLTRFEAQFVAFAFFIAYGLISFPAAALLSRVRAMPSIIAALIAMIVGCLIILLAANAAVFTLVLVGLFVLASGITILQVAANPLVAALGDPSKSHFRLTLSQTFNSLATFIAPILGSHLFLKGLEVKEGVVVTEEVRQRALGGIDTAYVWLCGMIAALALFMWIYRRTVTAALPAPAADSGQGVGALISDALSSKWALFGGAAIFLYVGAEVAIGTQMTAFLNDNAIWGLSDAPFAVPLLGATMGSDGIAGVSVEEAGKAVGFYWGGAMVGRAIGSVLLARFSAPKLLAVFTAIAAAMCLYVVMVGGVSAGFVALGIGLFNSIMFPVIFTITLERSTASTEATSGLLCTAIVGGALLPLLVGKVSEITSYHAALIVPAACYALLCVFAIASHKAKVTLRDEPTAATVH